MTRLAEVTVPQLTQKIGDQRARIKGLKIKVCSNKFLMFKSKGTSCIACGLEGRFFAVERSNITGSLHVNLYARLDNSEVLMTRDHIIPKSKGGLGGLDNSQPLCFPCNQKKGDSID